MDNDDVFLTPDLAWTEAMGLSSSTEADYTNSASRIYCKICQKPMKQGQTGHGVVIARCTCNDNTKRNVFIKCSSVECDEWHLIPKKGKRIKCKCDNIKFICKCYRIHTMKPNDTTYECVICQEKGDPFL